MASHLLSGDIMNLTETLESHFQLCQEVHQLLMEENRLLQATRKPPERSFLDRKQLLLPRLDDSVSALQIARLSASGSSSAHAPSIERTQKKMLAILLLDRENEKLLLKHSFQSSAARMAETPDRNTVRRAYAAAAAA
jgi:hypothetical protein